MIWFGLFTLYCTSLQDSFVLQLIFNGGKRNAFPASNSSWNNDSFNCWFLGLFVGVKIRSMSAPASWLFIRQLSVTPTPSPLPVPFSLVRRQPSECKCRLRKMPTNWLPLSGVIAPISQQSATFLPVIHPGFLAQT